MKDTHPLDLGVLVALESIRGLALLLRVVLVPIVALVLTLAGWRPKETSASQRCDVLPRSVSSERSDVITTTKTATVAELRKQARAAGQTRDWCRTARKAQLLEVLAVS